MIGPIICAGLFPLPHEGLPIPQLRAVLELGLAGLQRMMLWSKERGWPCRFFTRALQLSQGSPGKRAEAVPENASSSLSVSKDHLTCEL